MKKIHEVGKQMTKNSQKWSFMSYKFSRFFSFKTENQGTQKIALFSKPPFDGPPYLVPTTLRRRPLWMIPKDTNVF